MITVSGAVAGEHDTTVLSWVASTLGMQPGDFLPCASIGVMRDGVLLAGLVYHDFRRKAHGNMIEVSAVAADPAWASRRTLKALFEYAFVVNDCVRFELKIGRKNKHARDFAERLGFTLEGVLRKAYDGRADLMIYGMLRDECKWIRGKDHGIRKYRAGQVGLQDDQPTPAVGRAVQAEPPGRAGLGSTHTA